MSGKALLRFGVVAAGMFAACKFTHSERRPDGNSNDPPDAGVCSALTTECVGDMLRVCTAIATPPMDFPCGWGCIADSPAHCAHVVPSGSGNDPNSGVRPSDVVGDGLLDTTLAGGVTIDSDNGRIGTAQNVNAHHGAAEGIENGIDVQFRGSITMIRFKSLTIAGNITIVGRRPVALVSDGAIVINGIVDARGLCSANIGGPGGFNGGTPQGQRGLAPTAFATAGGEGASSASTGGGGGGHGGSGGAAKDSNGGIPFSDIEITTLLGGAGGGAGSGGGNFGEGGGGGGALQLISNVQVDIVAGGINAGGCGGESGEGNSDSGGGGGAGGAILIEAPIVTIAGTLAVNGGGGGGGGGGNAEPGADGTLDRTAAAAGRGDAPDEGGGSGAAGTTGAGSGEGGSNPGGGGGGIGRIRINTRNGTTTVMPAAVLSPSFDDPMSTATQGKAKVL